jgi:hypothetical protein
LLTWTGNHPTTHDEQVARRIEDYRNAALSVASATPDAPKQSRAYGAWNLAREDYRKVNLSGGPADLRDAEHYLFRYWVAAESGLVVIPDGLPINMSSTWNPTLPMHPLVMQFVHDPVYNSLRPGLARITDGVTPATPAMEQWEQRGYRDGYCASGDCQRVASWKESWQEFVRTVGWGMAQVPLFSR